MTTIDDYVRTLVEQLLLWNFLTIDKPHVVNPPGRKVARKLVIFKMRV